ncbi:hypothetical protein HYPBUDRAFT_194096 [Hyphopichia burtonii NRRL Y-1933]|uniref:Uncharacterized protein n=1 Tax=Hyphopichia burtonii NRRL Y-1933 TaxID=984485 RepID=A0A1E4RP69_9ASCO|nr:hypothetical protein HYPBUDRAFT_194096 [Hyphopichia burtonii NRRL Y-1933]ODV69072.1 hypothetical protein HYPBUDRAFT_194096 [Hyphopichia burtonii NRRL Y-1933]
MELCILTVSNCIQLYPIALNCSLIALTGPPDSPSGRLSSFQNTRTSELPTSDSPSGQVRQTGWSRSRLRHRIRVTRVEQPVICSEKALIRAGHARAKGSPLRPPREFGQGLHTATGRQA